jgi:hypothetical protein
MEEVGRPPPARQTAVFYAKHAGASHRARGDVPSLYLSLSLGPHPHSLSVHGSKDLIREYCYFIYIIDVMIFQSLLLLFFYSCAIEIMFFYFFEGVRVSATALPKCATDFLFQKENRSS